MGRFSNAAAAFVGAMMRSDYAVGHNAPAYNDAVPAPAEDKAPGGFETIRSTFAEKMARSDPPRRSTAALLKSYSTSPWMHQSTSKIAQRIGGTQWTISQPVSGRSGKMLDGRVAVVKRYQRAGNPKSKARALARMHSKGLELRELDDHPLLDLLERPNPLMSGFQLFEITQKHLSMVGQSYWHLNLGGLNGVPDEIWPIPPNWVTATPTKDSKHYEIDYRGTKRTLSPEEVISFSQLDPADPWGRGVGAGHAIADELDTDEYAAKTLRNFFFHRAVPELMIGIEGAHQKQLEGAEQKFVTKHRGAWNMLRPHFFSGKLSLHHLTQKFTDLQLVDLRKYEQESFRSMWSVPAELLGMTGNANRATITQARIIFGNETLDPAAESIRFTLQTQLLSRWDESLVMGFLSHAPDDEEFRLEAMSKQASAPTRGEWRTIQGLESREDLDEIHAEPATTLMRDPGGAIVSEIIPAPATGSNANPKGDGARSGQRAPSTHNAETAPVTKTPAQQADRVLEALDHDRLVAALVPEWEDRIQSQGDDVLQGLEVPGSFDLQSPAVVSHLDAFGLEHLTGNVGSTTQDAIRRQLIDGFKAGEGIEAIRKRVQGAFRTAKNSRARAIARTEVNRSANFGKQEAYEQSGVVDKKKWIVTRDGRLRKEKKPLDEKEIPLKQKFKIPEGSAMHPGDFGVAKLDINCRCALVAGGFDDDERDFDAIWKAADRENRKWERAAINLLRSAFSQQQADILAALENEF